MHTLHEPHPTAIHHFAPHTQPITWAQRIKIGGPVIQTPKLSLSHINEKCCRLGKMYRLKSFIFYVRQISELSNKLILLTTTKNHLEEVTRT